MPKFAVLKNKAFMGYVSAVSHAQAMERATKLHGRCEIMAQGNVPLDRKARTDTTTPDKSYSHGRSPYPTPGFEERRAALIAAHKAKA
jgi:hypothetical protein